MKTKTHSDRPVRLALVFALALLTTCTAFAQSVGDYRTVATGNWNNAATWERFDGVSFVPAPSAPNASDGVITIRAGHTVTANTAITADQVVVATGGTLVASGSTFTVADGAGTDLTVNGALQLTGATWSGPGTAAVTSGGTFTWTNGTIGNSATLDLAAGSNSTFSAGGSSLFCGGTINNAGTWTMLSGNLLQNGPPSQFNNLPGAIINLNGWANPTFSWSMNLNNQGTVNKSNGAVQFTLFSNTATNSGTIQVNSGEFFINTTTFTHTGAFTASPGGTVRSSSSTFNQNTGGTFGSPFTLSGGTMNVNSAATIASFTLSNGTLNGPQAIDVPTGGTFNMTGGFMGTTAILNLASGTTSTFDPGANLSHSGTINNSGTWTMLSGNFFASSSPALFNNLPGGTINWNSWTTPTSSWSVNLNNQGTVNKNNGAVQFTLGGSSTVTNSGTLNINSGEFFANGSAFTNTGTIAGSAGSILRSGATTFNHNSGAAITNLPTLHVSGGTFNLNAGSSINSLGQLIASGATLNCGIPVTTSAYTLSGGTVNGPQAIDVPTGGTFNMTGGFMGTTAILNLASGTTSTFNPGATSLSHSGTINNSGTWTMLSGNFFASSSPALFNNLPGAVVNLNGWTTPTSSWSVNLNNQGTVNKNNGAVQFTLGGFSTVTNSGMLNINSGEFFANGSAFTNTGTIAGSAGSILRSGATTFNHNSGGAINVPTLTVSGGTFNLNAGSTVGTLTQLNISGGTLNCGVALTTAAFAQSGGTLDGPQAVSVPTGGTFNMTGGFMGTTAILNLASGTTSTFDPGATSLSHSGTINNSGTWTMLSGNFFASSSPALFNNLPGAVVNLNGWTTPTSSWTVNLNNQGTVNKNNGAVQFTLGGFSTVTNSGTLNINSGEFFANGSAFTNTGTIAGSAGSILRSGATTFNHNSGAAITNLPTLHVSGGTFNLNAGSSINSLGQLIASGATLNCGIPVTTSAYTLSGGTVNGPQAIDVPTGGTFNMTGGFMGTTAILNLASGTTSTFDPGATSLSHSGTINNSGTWTMLSGNFFASIPPALFNNLPGAVVNLNGWTTPTSSWSVNLNNQGTVNKNNGAVQFTLGGFSTVTNSGTLNINSGEFFANGSAFTNTGTIAGSAGSILRSGATTFNHNSGAAITNLPTLHVSGGTFNLNTGSSINSLGQLIASGATLNCGIPVTTSAYTLSGGTVNGPQAIDVPTGGTFNMTGGFMGTTAILNLASGTTSTFDPGANLSHSGTINNSGTWTMLSGNFFASISPALFNNLPGAVLDLNGWTTPTSSWTVNLNNQGTVNKNNGAVQFTCTSSSFVNQPGGVWNINSGTWTHSATPSTQLGSINVASGATLASSNALNFGGTSITNNGAITTASVAFVGSAVQQLGGNGSINVLTINNASGVDLVGDQQVNNTLTFTNGRINAPANALVLASGATVTGAAANRYVNGAVRWNYPTGSGVTRVFPIGGATAFTPLTLEFASIGTAGSLTARSIDGDHPQVNTSLIAPDKSVNRHWSLSNNGIGFTTASATFTWVTGDVDAGANTAIFAVSKFDDPNWAFTATAAPLATSIQSTGITAFSDFQVGEPCVAPALTATPTDASCFGASDGAVALTLTGGTPAFGFAWSNGATTQNITGVPAGAYSVVVTTEGGCVANASATVNELPALTATIGLSIPAICTGESATVNVTGPANGSVVLSIDGGAGPTVNLNAFGNGSVGTGTLTSTTTYALVSASNDVCSNAVSGSAVLTVNPLPTVSCGTYPTACDIDPLIPLVGSPLGGTWSGTGVSGDNFDPAVGTQLLTYSFTDGNGCSNACTVTINVDPSSTFFADADGDGAGDPNVSQQACVQPPGFVANNNDGCPNDPLKTAPGICGCGVSDVDSDSDGTADCNDACPNLPFLVNGDPCDDGNPNTINDVVTNCVCAGTLLGDDCEGTPGGPAQPGTACNDNDVCTINDVYDVNCNCAGTFQDTDGDGTCDANDGCPTDPNKTAPGICGCGVSDVDTDGDGTADCNDGCPNDPNKITPGICGCGVSDVDSDSDGTADCNDACPLLPDLVNGDPCDDGNPNTINDVVTNCVCAGTLLGDDCEGTPGGPAQPGTACDDNDVCTINDVYDVNCNCAGTVLDSDNDGTCDANDGCPTDPNKTAPGICGCGVSDVDTDGDGTADCNDGCPNDPNKIAPGICGCGVSDVDSDSDGTADCNDACPLLPDLVNGDPCDDGNPNTINDVVTNCVCAGTLLGDDCEGTPGGPAQPGTACNDNDVCTINDVYDVNCNCAGTVLDSDNDGTCDANDGCPTDPNKTAPGICGCGVSDVDTDGDGTADCNDGCPNDPNKIAPGICGCGVSDVDSDSDGTADCNDACPLLPDLVNGDPCDDGNPNTINDVVTNCVCAGTLLGDDCEGTPGGPAQPGTACNDNDVCTINDVYDVNCNCAGTVLDSDNDGTCDANDGCPTDPNKTAPGICGCGVSDVDTDGDGTADCLDDCPNDPEKTSPGACGCGNLEPGTACDDNDPTTGNDVIQANCLCAGTPIDCNGDIGGTAFLDNCNTCVGGNTGLSPCAADCEGVFGGSALPGTACDDGNSNTTNDVYQPDCSCAGTPIAGNCENVTLEFVTGASPADLSWQFIDVSNASVAASGTGLLLPANALVQVPYCLAQNSCFLLSVSDAGDGAAGYQLRHTATQQRIIDNAGNLGTGTSQITGNAYSFCLPMGTNELIPTSCDKFFWRSGEFIVATEDLDVSALWVVGGANSVQPANTGYEFWFFNPNGGYSFRRFRSHNQSDGFSNVGATRTCHMKVNNWTAAQHIPEFNLHNVRVRARVNGVNKAWGPACRFVRNEALAACPPTKLMDIPTNPFLSCGQFRQFVSTQRVHARPVSGANLYQWRFRIPDENVEIIRTSTSYFLNLGWGPLVAAPLQNGKTYEVDVRASRDGGATWCGLPGDPWGDVCLLTIGTPPAVGGNQNMSLSADGTVDIALWPNPNNGDHFMLHITGLDEHTSTLAMDITDLSGKTVITRAIPVQNGMVNTTMDLQGALANGVYMVSFTSGDFRSVNRLVVQR